MVWQGWILMRSLYVGRLNACSLPRSPALLHTQRNVTQREGTALGAAASYQHLKDLLEQRTSGPVSRTSKTQKYDDGKREGAGEAGFRGGSGQNAWLAGRQTSMLQQNCGPSPHGDEAPQPAL